MRRDQAITLEEFRQTERVLALVHAHLALHPTQIATIEETSGQWAVTFAEGDEI